MQRSAGLKTFAEQDTVRLSIKSLRSRGVEMRIMIVLLAFWLLQPLPASAQTEQSQIEPAKRFNVFVKQQAAIMRANDNAPGTIEDWQKTRTDLRDLLLKAWGGFPAEKCALEARNLGEIQRDGYRVEKIVFQTMPSVWMTANAYVPEGKPGQTFPAVLCVHGHWAGAKQDPVVQSRCIGLAKLGFFVLCVDAFGAGERAIGEALGEYHGEMTGASLLLLGRPLSGIQVYENMRAVDYLQSRPEVDPNRLGVTGASGGGNQSMYAGAYDERFRCVVPTCSVGNYQAYLSAACCMCEVVPGILQRHEEGHVLGLAANRGLMVTSATQDAFQFSVDQARISISRAREIAALTSSDGPSAVKHTIIESPHHYNQPMREAMYGWMTKHLKGEGDGSPIPEPEIKPEEPEVLRCFPGESRPDDYVTIPRFFAEEARQLLKAREIEIDQKHLLALAVAKTTEDRNAVREQTVDQLAKTLNVKPTTSPLNVKQSKSSDGAYIDLAFETEPGLEISARCDSEVIEKSGDQKLAILLNVDEGAEKAFGGEQAEELRKQGYGILAPELRATGKFAVAGDRIGNAPDHNSAEWSLWIGRPLLGQWTLDVVRTLDALENQTGALPKEILICGTDSSGTVALTSAAIDDRISKVHLQSSLGTFVDDQKFNGPRLGMLVPGLLRDIGDIGHIAAMIAPRKLTIEKPVSASGRSLSGEASLPALKFCSDIYKTLGAADALVITTAD
jgi:dienelactone hydrolase